MIVYLYKLSTDWQRFLKSETLTKVICTPIITIINSLMHCNRFMVTNWVLFIYHENVTDSDYFNSGKNFIMLKLRSMAIIILNGKHGIYWVYIELYLIVNYYILYKV